MITFEEIKNSVPRKAVMGGYNAKDVDQLLDAVTQTLKQHEEEKANLNSKLKILGERIEKYRENEEIIQNALFNAQKIQENAKEEAKVQAYSIISRAKKEADKIVAEANGELDSAKKEIELLKKQADGDLAKSKEDFLALQTKISDFRTKIIQEYKQHLNLVTALPNMEDIYVTCKQLESDYPTVTPVKAPGASQNSDNNENKEAASLSSNDENTSSSKEYSIDEISAMLKKHQEEAVKIRNAINEEKKEVKPAKLQTDNSKENEVLQDDTQSEVTIVDDPGAPFDFAVQNGGPRRFK